MYYFPWFMPFWWSPFVPSILPEEEKHTGSWWPKGIISDLKEHHLLIPGAESLFWHIHGAANGQFLQKWTLGRFGEFSALLLHTEKIHLKILLIYTSMKIKSPNKKKKLKSALQPIIWCWDHTQEQLMKLNRKSNYVLLSWLSPYKSKISF